MHKDEAAHHATADHATNASARATDEHAADEHAVDGHAVDAEARSELRLGVAFTGGVSLAVWMGGVAREMNLLTAAARPGGQEPAAPADRLVKEKYRALLELLRLDMSIDVVSGTSAGGINAAFLGLATVRRCDLSGLRDMWLAQGALDRLLRRPSEPAPPSLLHGDRTLLGGLREGLRQLVADVPHDPAHDDDPMRVFITTTLLNGLDSPFEDDYGTVVRDTTHRGLFSFDAPALNANAVSAHAGKASGGNASGGDTSGGTLGGDDIVDALALAARSSASFPGAFEPAYVPIGTPGTDGHPDMARHAVPGTRTQFCADGGLLVNRPLGPALEAVFERGADREVRRVLAYVVPTPGIAEARVTPGQQDTPALGPALLADLAAIRSQSISAELRSLLAHNKRVRGQERAESRLAWLAGPDGTLSAGRLLADYRAVRAGALGRAAAGETLRALLAHGRSTAQGAPAGFGTDLERLAAAATETVHDRLPDTRHLGGDSPYDALAGFGRPALDGAKATVLRLLRAGFGSAALSAGGRGDLGDLVRRAHVTAGRARTAQAGSTAVHGAAGGGDLHGAVLRGLAAALPTARALPPDAVARLIASAAWQDAVRSPLPTDAARTALGEAWRGLAAVVLDARGLLARLLPADGADAGVLTYLTGGAPAAGTTGGEQAAGGTGPNAAAEPAALAWVARRLFELHAAQLVMYPDEPTARQLVELIQVSADTRTLLDPRALAEEKLTGLQLYHFGAFYKNSWRANDWMWGRLDGAGWLVHVVLAPRLLVQLVREHVRTVDELVAGLEKVAGTPAPAAVRAELARVATAAPASGPAAATAPAGLDVTSRWVAGGLQRLIAAEELGCVAQQAELDRARGTAGASADFLAAHREVSRRGRAAAGPAANPGNPHDPAAPGNPHVLTDPADPADIPLREAERLLNACAISKETFTDELGTRPLRRVALQAAAVGANAVATGTVRWRLLRPLFLALRTSLRLADRLTRR